MGSTKKKKSKSRKKIKVATEEAAAKSMESTRRESNVGDADKNPPSKDVSGTTVIVPNSFHSVKPPLSEGVLNFLASLGFHTMTPVQAAAIPLFLTNKDVAVQAVTGSGKTLSFLIPIVEMILRRTVLLTNRQVAALVLAPTRELARQTYEVACGLCRYASISEPLLLVGGGSSYRPVSEDLRSFQKLGSDIVIGTPGRIEDVLTRYDVMDVSEMECLVLDEADVLLDMGFDVTLNTILSKLPKMRRTGLFSATGTGGKGATGAGSRGIKELMTRAGMRNPVWVNVAITSHQNEQIQSKPYSKKEANTETDPADCSEEDATTGVGEQATPSSLTNYYIISPMDEKLSRLVAFLQSHREETIIVFFLTCACVEFHGAALQQLLQDQYVELLHGKMVQKRREKAMERFRESAASENLPRDKANGGILLCTDVAARGLDVSGVNWVVQFDAPQDPASFVHRVGRTARIGRSGSSLLFLTEKEESYIDFLRNRKVPLHSIPDSEYCAPPSWDKKLAHSNAKSVKSAQEGSELATRRIRSAQDSDISLPDVLPQIRAMALADRDILEKGTKAFTSYIRAYKQHHCAFIFRFASLDLGLLATSFCLLRLPKMPELRDKVGKLNFQPAGPEIDIHSIPFKDNVREQARQKRLAAELSAGGKNAKQIKAERRQAERLLRKKELRQQDIDKGRNPDKKRGRQQMIFDEWDELAKEERLFKKLRSGKISKEKYNELLYGKSNSGGRNEDRPEELSDE